MKVKRVSSKIVKPYYGENTPCPPTDTVVPLSVFDTITYNIHMAVVYAYNPPIPSSATIEHGLAVALSEYREWAGRLGKDAGGRPAVVLNDGGAKFVEATVDGPLDRSILSQPSKALLSLHPSLYDVEELVQVQITRFSCGSMSIGFTAHHFIADGHSTSNFLMAWGKAARGMSMEPLPLHGRTAFFTPREPRLVEFEHRGVEFIKRPVDAEENGHDDHHDDHDEADPNAPKVVIQKSHFSKDFLSKLKSRASVGSPRPFSTFESLQAHLWRVMTRARGLPEDQPTQIRISVNGRQRLRLPNEYFGNLVLWAFPQAKAGDLLANPLGYAARVIHDGVARVDDSYFRSFIDFATSPAVEEEGLASSAVLCKDVLCPNMEVDSWLRFPFYDLDFGGGGPFAFMPTYFNIEGMLFLLPSFVGDGSVDAFVPVFEKDLEAFRRICHTIE